MTTLAPQSVILNPASLAGSVRPAAIAEAFRQALVEAESFAGATSPNPPVGCVILDGRGRVLARAAHQTAGRDHAEAAAISVCRRAECFDRIHTVVVTLEPCNHHGRTPPCAPAILTTPAQAVWIGARDPNPRVVGGGAAHLAAGGLAVSFVEDLNDPVAPALAQAAHRLIAPFSTWSSLGRPFLTLKQALTSDGSMIPPVGAKTFTSPKSLVLAHRLRRRADAIITGSGTILADGPDFTVRRVADHVGKCRILAILDRRRRTPASYIEAARCRGFDVRVRDDIDDLLAELAGEGVLEALVEAGPTLTGEFLNRGVWDEQVIIRKAVDGGEPDAVTILHRQSIEG